MATFKHRPGISVRKNLLRKIAQAIASSRKEKDFRLILIHGAGGAGHQLAHKYGLKDGIGKSDKKWLGAFESRLANQQLDTAITQIFTSAGLRITPAHTASIIIQKNKRIFDCNIRIIEEALRWDCIPLIYGEMVFDTELGMSICSGDAIAPYLAEKLAAEKIFFASDIEGVFDQDPHRYKNAKLVERIGLAHIRKAAKLTESHNTDVTGGLKGKISQLDLGSSKSLESIEIFNGLKSDNFKKILLGEKFPHTKIYIKKDGPRPSRKAC